MLTLKSIIKIEGIQSQKNKYFTPVILPSKCFEDNPYFKTL